MLDNNAFFKLGSSESKILNKAYTHSISQILNKLGEDEMDRLDTYNLIITDWVESDNTPMYDEFKYRVTDGESIDEVFLDIINRDDANSGVTYTVRFSLEKYIKDDKYKRFSK